MPSTYTRTFGLMLALTLVASVAFAQATDQPRPPAQQPSAQQPPAGQPPAQRPPAQEPSQAKPQAQIARGELSSIDATAKMLTIKPADGAEQKFQYNEQTKVTGAQGGVAGLATMSGKQVVVHFTSQGANRVASEIEIQADKSDK